MPRPNMSVLYASIKVYYSEDNITTFSNDTNVAWSLSNS